VVLEYTLYELMVQLEGGVTAVQLRLMALEEVAVAVKPVGAVGDALQVPPLPSVVAVTCDEGPDAPFASTASTT
jgi:hypothetical protein